MFTVTPETHALLSLLIMVAAFLIAQIVTHPGTRPAKAEAPNSKAATNH
ncbi:MAG: hypothetical protein ACOY93_19055 [Bacillota bacterium]